MDRLHLTFFGRIAALPPAIIPSLVFATVFGSILLPPSRVFSQVPEAPSVELQFPNNPLSEILLEYELLTGKKIIKDVNVLGATVSVETTGKLTREEAAVFIEKTLLLNGYAFVPSGHDTLKIIAWSGGKQPRGEGVPIYSRAEDLPDSDQIVSYFMPLTYITTEEAVRTFSQVLPSHPYGVVTPVPNASAVIITDNSSVIQSLIELKEHVDVQPAQVVNKSIQLERSDAEQIAAILMELLGAQSDQGSGGSSSRSLSAQRAQPGPPGAQPGAIQASLALQAGQAGADGGSTSESIQPQIVPIVRTNRLLVIARPIDMTYIESLVEEFDAPAEIKSFLKRKLSYMRVTDFLPIASDALSRGQDEEGGAGATLGQGLGRTTTTRTPTSQLGAGRTGATGAGGTGGIGGTGGGGTGIGGGAELAAPEDLGGPTSLVIGKTLLIADGQANTLIVSGPPEHLRIINELLDELDLRSSQIYLSTLIGQVTLGDTLDWNLTVLRTFQEGSDVGGAGLFRSDSGNNASVIIDPAGLTDIGQLPVLSGLSIYGTIGEHLNAFLRTLEATTDFTVLSRPSIFVRNNVRASIRSGQRIAVPTSTLTSLQTGVNTPSVSSSIDFEDVVLELTVVPLINSDDEVTLQIVQTNDNVVGTDIVGGNEVPIISTQVLETEVTLPNKSTVILGGLISNDTLDNKVGFPFLVHVPVLKHLFGSTSRTVNRSELLIFLQPHIINGESDLIDANVDLTRRSEVANKALDFGLAPPAVEPTGARGDVIADEIAMQAAWEEEIRRKRQAEMALEEEAETGSKGLFKGRDKKRATIPGKRSP